MHPSEKTAVLSGAEALAMLWRASLDRTDPNYAGRTVEDILSDLDISSEELERQSNLLYGMVN